MRIEPNQQDVTNPFLPKNLFALFFQPKKFFALSVNYPQWSIVFSGYLLGVFTAMDRIDQKLMNLEISGKNNELMSRIAESWSAYWLSVLLIGVICGAIAWMVYGWWYSIRLRWSGAKNVDKVLARKVMVLQNLVYAIPVIVTTMVQTLFYPTYLAAYNAASITISGIFLISLFLSCWVSYRGVTTLFSLNRAAIFWFLILPIGCFILVSGLFISLSLAAL
ncbi:hypothetical protein [Acinetobacter sp. MD2]|uniref:hypothetical protein n=1 Tax=Acinetobacter sp. MD2 TaxID=2600066 RepID=UPI002D1F86F3|nr:hypothetical protein [Acinetobacter sp. MD2]MEB3767211.1 hypothetical protein [Acinetobacter sp. MD2]